MWGLLPHHVMQNANPRRADSLGSSHTQALLYRVSSMQELINTGTNSQGLLHISDLLLHTDLHLTYINTSLSSLSGPWKRQQQTPALSYRQVLTHQYLYLAVSSLFAEAGNFHSPRSRLQGFSSERRLSQSFFREFSRPSV